MLSIRLSKNIVLQIHPTRSMLKASIGCNQVPAAGLGITLAEIMAAMADELSQYQDRIAAEAYLDTSVRSRSTGLRKSVRKICKVLTAIEELMSRPRSRQASLGDVCVKGKHGQKT
jgi:hypothetical protein